MYINWSNVDTKCCSSNSIKSWISLVSTSMMLWNVNWQLGKSHKEKVKNLTGKKVTRKSDIIKFYMCEFIIGFGLVSFNYFRLGCLVSSTYKLWIFSCDLLSCIRRSHTLTFNKYNMFLEEGWVSVDKLLPTRWLSFSLPRGFICPSRCCSYSGELSGLRTLISWLSERKREQCISTSWKRVLLLRSPVPYIAL